MKKLLFICAAAFAIPAFAQQAPAAQSPAAGGAQAAGAQPARPPQAINTRTNEQTGVTIDRFLGDPLNSIPHLSHGGLITANILKPGNPYEPGAPGAVLEYRKDLSKATLLGNQATQLVTSPDHYMFYVKGGEGRLDDGRQAWDLHEFMAILVPPNVPHRFTNVSDKPLTMIMLTWTPSAPPRKDILVRDINRLPWCEENAHWNNFSKCVFGRNDGLMESERVLMVMLPPWQAAQPHTHPPGFEEIWTKVSPGTGLALIGSQLRKYPENAAYRVPPNGVTEHSHINVSETQAEWYLYVARDRAKSGDLVTGVGTPGGIPASATPPFGPLPSAVIPPRPNPNPNIVRDGTSLPAVQVADVPGKPLK